MTRRHWTLLLIVAAVVLLLVWACGRTKRPVPKAQDLLVDSSALPRGWKAVHGPMSLATPYVLEDQGARDFAGVSFAPPGGSWAIDAKVGQCVWRFDSQAHALVEFYTRFRPHGKLLPEMMAGWSYRSSAASRVRVYCAQMDWPVESPKFFADVQYGEFITTFAAPAGEGGITLHELEALLRAADERAAEQFRMASEQSE